MNFAAFEIVIVYIYMNFVAIITVHLTVTGTDLLQ